MSGSLLALLVVICFAVLLLGANTWRNWANLSVVRHTAAVRAATLSAFTRMVPPGADPAHPGAILLSGCDGVHDNMYRWAEVLQAQTARPALVLDSHGPRGLCKYEAWRLVCAGQILPGAERAGDLAVTLAGAKAGGIVILAASHGGWTVLEFLQQVQSGQKAPGLKEWPAPAEALIGKVKAVILLYPYCGVMNRAGRGDWSKMPPILMILPQSDTIVSTSQSQQMAERLRSAGATVSVVVMPGADHAFDQKEKALWSRLAFNEATTQRAERHIREFISGLR